MSRCRCWAQLATNVRLYVRVLLMETPHAPDIRQTGKAHQIQHPYLTSVNITSNFATMATERWKSLLVSLEDQHIPTTTLQRPRYEWLLLQQDSTTQQLRIFQTLMSAPMIVPNTDLNTVLDMTLSTAESPHTAPGHHMYDPSWMLTGH